MLVSAGIIVTARKMAVILVCAVVCTLKSQFAHAADLNLPDIPLFINGSKTTLLQLVMQRDNKLFFEAYPTYEDINGDGVLDTTYKPHEIDYYGYFDSHFCYESFADRLEAVSESSNKKCPGNWSGDFLNYVSMTRMDVLLAALYGGKRVVDTPTETRLRRAFVPWENHTWGIEYESEAVNGFKLSDYTPLPEPLSGRRHLLATNNIQRNAVPYLRIRRDATHRIWHWVDKERTQGDGYADLELVLDVTVCKTGFLEEFCKLYPDGNFKPIGLLHEYGENDAMYFSMLSGSFNNNLQGGVLRQTMGSFGAKEVDPDNGTFTGNDGIVTTMDALQIPNDFYAQTVQRDCAWIANRTFENGECRAWGNPVAEMMYEGLRYFSGVKEPTPEFFTSGDLDERLGLAPATWDDPYAPSQPYGQCSGAYQLVISDPSPSFDGDQLPGSDFSSFNSTSLGDMHVGDIADFVSQNESVLPGLKFIGETDSNKDRAPTPKNVSSFRNIRGQAPEAPHRQGSYYAPSVAYYGATNDINPHAPGKQTVGNFTLALGSPLPSIDVEVAGKTISFVPFARTVDGCGGAVGDFRPTNAIVGFNVESVNPASGSFRVSYEDMEQGADNDMDAIARYSYEVVGDSLTMKVDSLGASGCFIQHMGYSVSGSTEDGVYLVVRDSDTSDSIDPDYELDVPPGELPGGNWEDGVALPLTSTIVFVPAPTPAAEVLPSPLWYAAKWGGFDDVNEDGIPQVNEWDSNLDGIPDNYFPVTDPAKMLTTMRRVFQKISETAGAASAVTSSSGSLRTGNKVYRSMFVSGKWTGDVESYTIDATGTVADTPDWSAREALREQVASNDREILTYNPESNRGVPFRWPANPAATAQGDISAWQVQALSLNPVSGQMDGRGEDRISFLRGESIDNFRLREDVLGDIIHSSPVLVGPPAYYYPDEWGDGAAENSKPYSDFARQHRHRQRVVYVGANDGMLHALDAGKWSGNEYTDGDGSELFAYVPSPVYPNLPELTSQSYSHKHYVDATPRAADVFINGEWRTVLIGGLRGGGQGIYALDITKPGDIKESTATAHVLWEFTDEQDKSVGFTYSSPVIARMANGKWAAIMANGYNNSKPQVGYGRGGGWSSIIIVDIASGELVRKLHPLTERCRGNAVEPNGSARPTAVDIDNDNKVDTIYAGDLNGCVYAFDVSDKNPSRWKSGELKHEAVDDTGRSAPITSPIVVGTHPTGEGVMLYFGTGKYLEPKDQYPGAAKRRLYGLWDRGKATDTANRTKISEGKMVEQKILTETTQDVDLDDDGVADQSVNVRRTSQEPIDWERHEGWYLNLEYGGYYGEQILAAPLLRDGKLLVATHIPTGDECAPQQDGWFMVFDARNGAMLTESPIDLNGDGKRNDSTLAGVSGLVNPHASPTILAAENADVLLSQTITNPEVVSATLHSGFREGRLTWREIEP